MRENGIQGFCVALRGMVKGLFRNVINLGS